MSDPDGVYLIPFDEDVPVTIDFLPDVVPSIEVVEGSPPGIKFFGGCRICDQPATEKRVTHQHTLIFCSSCAKAYDLGAKDMKWYLKGYCK